MSEQIQSKSKNKNNKWFRRIFQFICKTTIAIFIKQIFVVIFENLL